MSGRFKLIFALLAVLLCMPVLCIANPFEDAGLFGDPVEVMVLPNRMNGQLIGINILTITRNGNVGTAFLTKKSFYRFGVHKITEDSTYFLIKGYDSDNIADIERNDYEQEWSADNELIKQFDMLVKIADNPHATPKQLRMIYHKFRFSPFSQKAGERQDSGHQIMKWFLGKQLYKETSTPKGIPFTLNASKRYGNRFLASFNSPN